MTFNYHGVVKRFPTVGYPVADSRNPSRLAADTMPGGGQCFEDQADGSMMIDKSRILSVLLPVRYVQADGRPAKPDPLDQPCRKQRPPTP